MKSEENLGVTIYIENVGDQSSKADEESGLQFKEIYQ